MRYHRSKGTRLVGLAGLCKAPDGQESSRWQSKTCFVTGHLAPPRRGGPDNMDFEALTQRPEHDIKRQIIVEIDGPAGVNGLKLASVAVGIPDVLQLCGLYENCNTPRRLAAKLSNSRPLTLAAPPISTISMPCFDLCVGSSKSKVFLTRGLEGTG